MILKRNVNEVFYILYYKPTILPERELLQELIGIGLEQIGIIIVNAEGMT